MIPTYALAELWIGFPALNAVTYALANVAEVALMLCLMRSSRTVSLAFDNLKDLLTMSFVAGLASPLGGLIGAAGAAHVLFGNGLGLQRHSPHGGFPSSAST